MTANRFDEFDFDDSPFPVPGTYQGDHSLIELVPDFYVTGGWLLHVNGIPSSHIVVDEPRALVFPYMKWIAAGVEATLGARDHKAKNPSITHLGGGACTLPRYFADVYPASTHTVVELDGALVNFVNDWFGIPPTVQIQVGDALQASRNFGAASNDVIIRDTFNGPSAPYPMTTVDFFADCRRGLSAAGLFVANCGDSPDLTATREEIAGLSQVFSHVAAISETEMLNGRKDGNVVLLASDAPLPEHMLPDANLATSYLSNSEVRGFAAGAEPRIEL